MRGEYNSKFHRRKGGPSISCYFFVLFHFSMLELTNLRNSNEILVVHCSVIAMIKKKKNIENNYNN